MPAAASYSEADVEIAAVCDRRSRATGSHRGICARSGRRPTARSGLLEALVAPALRSRNPERRRAGLDDLQRAHGVGAGALPAPARAERAKVGELMATIDFRSKIREVPGLPGAGGRLQGHHAAARRPGGASPGGRRACRLDRRAQPGPRPRRRGARLLARRRDRVRGRLRVRAGAPPGQAPAADRLRAVRARVRRERARGERGRDRAGRPRRHPRRRARDRRNRERDRRPRRAARRPRGRRSTS